jgi:hypothetical protein
VVSSPSPSLSPHDSIQIYTKCRTIAPTCNNPHWSGSRAQVPNYDFIMRFGGPFTGTLTGLCGADLGFGRIVVSEIEAPNNYVSESGV